MKIELNIDELLFVRNAIDQVTIQGKNAQFLAKLQIRLDKIIDKNIDKSKEQ